MKTYCNVAEVVRVRAITGQLCKQINLSQTDEANDVIGKLQTTRISVATVRYAVEFV